MVIAAELNDRTPTTLAITVTDSGDGIPAEHLDHIFDRFYRVDSSRDRLHGGSGVGLAIARAITVAHGGTIHASSAGAGHGSTFTITLPTASLHTDPSDLLSKHHRTTH